VKSSAYRNPMLLISLSLGSLNLLLNLLLESKDRIARCRTAGLVGETTRDATEKAARTIDLPVRPMAS